MGVTAVVQSMLQPMAGLLPSHRPTPTTQTYTRHTGLQHNTPAYTPHTGLQHNTPAYTRHTGLHPTHRPATQHTGVHPTHRPATTHTGLLNELLDMRDLVTGVDMDLHRNTNIVTAAAATTTTMTITIRPVSTWRFPGKPRFSRVPGPVN